MKSRERGRVLIDRGSSDPCSLPVGWREAVVGVDLSLLFESFEMSGGMGWKLDLLCC